jgi:hypothetical protein
MLSRLVFALTIAATIVTTAYAHETRPRGWCSDPDARPEVVSTFSLDSMQLHRLALGYGTPDHCPIATCGSCGGVDEWHPALRIAQDYCKKLSGKPDLTEAIILTPGFNSSAHHTDYKFSDGLTGQCVVCR